LLLEFGVEPDVPDLPQLEQHGRKFGSTPQISTESATTRYHHLHREPGPVEKGEYVPQTGEGSSLVLG